jgi:uncharacterized protein YkwD
VSPIVLKPELLGIVLCSALLTACGGQSDEPSASNGDQDGGGPNASPNDSSESVQDEAPQDATGDGFVIISQVPEPNAEERALVTDIAIEFNHPPMAETISQETLYLTADGARVAVERRHNAGSNRVALIPEQPLEPDQEYRVHVTEALMGRDGHAFTGTSWRFTTTGHVGHTSQATLDRCMSESDIEMLSRINNARASAQSCGDEAMAAVEPLAWHCTIKTAAEAHSEDMAQHDFFSHTGSDGSSAGERLHNAGYDWRAWAENIAAGQRTVEQTVRELLESPGHCVNIMNPRFTEMGAALAENPDAYYRRYWTQNFARPRNR